MPDPSGAPGINYLPAPSPPYVPGTRPNLGVGAPGDVPARGFPQTLLSVRATNDADKGNATTIPACAAFSIVPAATPIATSGRTVSAGSYPVIAHILDEGGSEVAPPLIITGPQVFRFGSICKGIRLESTTLAAGADFAYDVTISPSPASWWDIPTDPSAYPFVDFRLSAVAQAAGWTNEFIRPVGAHNFALYLRNPNVLALSGSMDVRDPDGTYPVTGGNHDVSGAWNVAGGSSNRLYTLAAIGPGGVGATIGFSQATNFVAAALGAIGAIKIVHTQAADAGTQFRVVGMWF